MKLKERIRHDRKRLKAREPLPETGLTVVAAIVQQFELKARPGEGEGGPGGAKTAPGGRLGLFPLLTPEQWRLAKEITARYDNPYLPYARSPAEICLSLRLYGSKPDLAAEVLQAVPLEELWAREGE